MIVGMLEIDGIMCEKIKRKVTEVYKKRIKLLMKSHLNEKNVFLSVITWAVPLIRYSATFLDWTKEETKELDQSTQKQLLGRKALYPKSNVIKIYTVSIEDRD